MQDFNPANIWNLVRHGTLNYSNFLSLQVIHFKALNIKTVCDIIIAHNIDFFSVFATVILKDHATTQKFLKFTTQQLIILFWRIPNTTQVNHVEVLAQQWQNVERLNAFAANPQLITDDQIPLETLTDQQYQQHLQLLAQQFASYVAKTTTEPVVASPPANVFAFLLFRKDLTWQKFLEIPVDKLQSLNKYWIMQLLHQQWLTVTELLTLTPEQLQRLEQLIGRIGIKFIEDPPITFGQFLAASGARLQQFSECTRYFRNLLLQEWQHFGNLLMLPEEQFKILIRLANRKQTYDILYKHNNTLSILELLEQQSLMASPPTSPAYLSKIPSAQSISLSKITQLPPNVSNSQQAHEWRSVALPQP